MISEERIMEIHPMLKDFTHWKLAFAREIEREAYKAGQEDMRKRILCAKVYDDSLYDFTQTIIYLEIEEPK